MSGERPNFWKDAATEARPFAPPGREPARPESPESPPDEVEGAAFSRPLMPGTAAATLLKFAALKRLLAKPNNAPAPPIACFGVMESCFVSWSTSAGLGFFAVF